MMEYKGYLAAVEFVRSDRRGRDSARVLNLHFEPNLVATYWTASSSASRTEPGPVRT